MLFTPRRHINEVLVTAICYSIDASRRNFETFSCFATTVYCTSDVRPSRSQTGEGPYRFTSDIDRSVPARLGKGQGAKEIGHNLARDRPQFWHNLVRKRHKIFYAWTTKIWSCGRLMKTWAQICKHFTSIFTSAVWKHKNSNYIL